MNSFFNGFPKNKRVVILIGLAVFGLLLVLISPSFESGKESTEALTLSEYKSMMEKELAELCSSIDGVGKCTVKLSFSQGEESIYKGGQIVKTNPPVVLGAAVVCRGADSAAVRRAVTELLTSLLNIPTNRIAILKLN